MWGNDTPVVVRPSDDQLRQIVKGRQLAGAVRRYLAHSTTGHREALVDALARYDANPLQPDKQETK